MKCNKCGERFERPAVTRYIDCSHCNGTGIGMFGDPETSKCTICAGSGQKPLDEPVEVCPDCGSVDIEEDEEDSPEFTMAADMTRRYVANLKRLRGR